MKKTPESYRQESLQNIADEVAKTIPHVFVNHDIKNKKDAALALKVANTFRGYGIEATTTAVFCQPLDLKKGTPNDAIDQEIREHTDMVIEILSMKRVTKNEGVHEAISTAIREESEFVGEGKTMFFPITHRSEIPADIAKNWRIPYKVPHIGIWDDSELATKYLLLGMLLSGPTKRKNKK